MKKGFILLLSLMVLFSSVSFAGELFSLSDEDLLALYRQVSEELESRNIPAETPEVSDDTVLYYSPEGGQYYHIDRNCRRVHEKYLPLSGTMTYGELENEAYMDLQPCEVCGAPARRNSRSVPVTFRDAVDAAEEGGFAAPDIIPAEGIGDFIGEWQYYRITDADGSEMSREEMLADGLVDDHAEMIITEDELRLYTASMGDAGSVKYAFIPEDGSLEILNESDDHPVLYLTDNGMLFFFMPSGPSFGDMTAYLVRREP